MGAIDAALNTIDAIAAEGDLAPAALMAERLDLEAAGEPIVLPDGKRIYPPLLHGEPVDRIACDLLDMDDPAASTFLRLIGPPGAGKSQIARAIAHRLWTERGRTVAERHGVPFYGFVEMQPGPSSDEYFFRYDYVPVAGAGGQVALVDSAFVEAMREGWVVMIDEVNTARDVCLLSINATLDGRLALYLAATGETVTARPGFAVLLAYNPGLVGATDIPDAWHSRFPATLEVSLQLGGARAARRARAAGGRGDAARPSAHGRRGRADLDAAVPRHRGAVADDRPHRRTAGARVLCLQPARASPGRQGPGRRGGRRLPDARPGRLRAPEGRGHRRAAEPARLPAGGDRLMPATRTRPPLFVAQLHRASAQRGKLDPLFQELSDHWTAILQRLYPVWALIGPGLSDPGHIEIHSRTIYLDSDELLGPREQIAASKLAPRAILTCFGVALHETLHAKHTKRWAIEHDLELAASADPADRQLAADRQLLEEPRMEAHGVRSFAPDSVRGRFVRRALQAAVVDVILPRFAEQILQAALAGEPLSRDMAGRAMVYLQARTHYGIVDRAVLGALDVIWRRTLGADDSACSTSCSRGSCGSRTATWTRSTAPRAPTATSSARPTRRPPVKAQPARAGPAIPGIPVAKERRTAVTGRPATARRVAGRRASSTRSSTPAPGSSSSSTRTSTSRPCWPPPATATDRRAVAATGPDGRAGGCPTAASTAPRSPTRSSRRAATPPACAKRSRKARAGSTSARPAGASTGAPTRADKRSARPAGRSAPTRGRSPARCARRSRPRTSG